MVLLGIINGIITGITCVAGNKGIKDNEKFNEKLTEEDLKLIEEIEALEHELINQGLNPESLTLEQVYQYLTKESNKNEGKKYSKFLQKIEQHRRESPENG